MGARRRVAVKTQAHQTQQCRSGFRAAFLFDDVFFIRRRLSFWIRAFWNSRPFLRWNLFHPEQLFASAVGCGVNSLEDAMKNPFAVSLIAVSLLASSAAFAQSTTATGAVNGARTGGEVAGPVGEVVGGTVGAAVGAGLEIPNAVITSIQGERAPSVTVRERVVVGEPLPSTVQLRPVPNYTEYRYAVVNDRRVIVEPRTRKIVKIID
jgi:hypothetical protein